MTQPVPESLLKSRRSPIGRLVAALNPRRYLMGVPGPIFRKEMLVGSRRKSTYILRGGFVLIVAALMAFMLMVSLSSAQYGGNAFKLQRYQTIAPNVTQLVSWCMFVLLSLMAITRGSSSISDERRMGTLSALMTTPLSGWQIVAGKLCGAMSELIIIGLSMIPVLLAVRVFGGVTAETVLIAAAFTLIHALFCTAVAMSWSVSAKSANNAAVKTFLTVIAFEIGLPLGAMLADVIVRDVMGVGFATMSTRYLGFSMAPESLFALTLSPLVFAFAISGDASILPPGAPREFVYVHLIYVLILSILFLLSTVALLRRRLAKDMEGTTDRPTKGSKSARKKSAQAGAATDGDAAQTRSDASGSRSVGDAPVLWRELQQGAFKKKRIMVVATAFVGVLMAWIYARVGLADEIVHFPTFVIASLGITAFAAATTTSSFSTERESRTWETLISTPLTAHAIVTGKFFGTLRRQWFLPAILSLHGAISIAGGALDPRIMLSIPILVGPVLLLTATGCALGLVFRKGSVASTLNFVVALALYAFIPLFFVIVSEFLPGRGISDWLLSIVLIPNPMPMCIVTLEAVIRESWRYNQELTHPFRVFDLGSFSTVEYTLLILGVFLFYVVATWLVLKAAIARLARETGRLK